MSLVKLPLFLFAILVSSYSFDVRADLCHAMTKDEVKLDLYFFRGDELVTEENSCIPSIGYTQYYLVTKTATTRELYRVVVKSPGDIVETKFETLTFVSADQSTDRKVESLIESDYKKTLKQPLNTFSSRGMHKIQKQNDKLRKSAKKEKVPSRKKASEKKITQTITEEQKKIERKKETKAITSYTGGVGIDSVGLVSSNTPSPIIQPTHSAVEFDKMEFSKESLKNLNPDQLNMVLERDQRLLATAKENKTKLFDKDVRKARQRRNETLKIFNESYDKKYEAAVGDLENIMSNDELPSSELEKATMKYRANLETMNTVKCLKGKEEDTNEKCKKRATRQVKRDDNYKNAMSRVDQKKSEEDNANNVAIQEKEISERITKLLISDNKIKRAISSVDKSILSKVRKEMDAKYLYGDDGDELSSLSEPNECLEGDYLNKKKDVFSLIHKNPKRVLKEKGHRLVLGRMATLEVSPDGNFSSCEEILRNSKKDFSDGGCSGLANIEKLISSKQETKINSPAKVQVNSNLTVDIHDSKLCNDIYYAKFEQCMGFKNEVTSISTFLSTPGKIFYRSEDGSNRASSEDKFMNVENVPKVSNENDSPFKKLAEHRYIYAYQEVFSPCLTYNKVMANQKYEDGEEEDDVEAQNKGQQEITSFDGQFKCLKPEPWTQDYASCKRLIQTYNVTFITDAVGGLADQGYKQVQGGKIQEGQITDMTEGKDQLETGLNAQKRTFDMNKKSATARAALSGAKAIALGKAIHDYKTPSTESLKCGEGDQNLESGVESAYYCRAAATWAREDMQGFKLSQLFPNQDVKTQMWRVVMQAGTQAALATLEAIQFGKAARDVQLYKEKFSNLVDESNTESVDVGLDYCKFNPASSQCLQRGDRVISSAGSFGYGDIESQGGSQDFNIVADDSAIGEYVDEDGNTKNQAAIDDLSGIIDNDGTDRLGSDFNAPGAGGSSKGTALGSGGSAGSAGGGAAGGGGAAPGGSKRAGSAKYSVSSSAPKYGPSGGTVAYSQGSNSRSKKASKNPFSKMFGSKRSRSVASNIDDIAPSHSGLFDKISKRYNQLSTDKRLLNFNKASQ